MADGRVIPEQQADVLLHDAVIELFQRAIALVLEQFRRELGEVFGITLHLLGHLRVGVRHWRVLECLKRGLEAVEH